NRSGHASRHWCNHSRGPRSPGVRIYQTGALPGTEEFAESRPVIVVADRGGRIVRLRPVTAITFRRISSETRSLWGASRPHHDCPRSGVGVGLEPSSELRGAAMGADQSSRLRFKILRI